MMLALQTTTPRLPRTEAVANRIVSVAETDSTNALAAQMIADGSLVLPPMVAGSGADRADLPVALVVADRQVAGRGRNGHSWISQPGCCSTISYVVRLPRAIALDPSVNGWLQMIAGLATLDALNGMIEEYGASMIDAAHFLELKWPNDVFCHGLKLGGLLSEVVMIPGSEDVSDGDVALVFGVGLNLALGPSRLPTAKSTSLQLHATGLPSFDVMQDAVAVREVKELGRRLAEFVADPQGQAEALRAEMRTVCWARGREVEAHFTDGSSLVGEAIGLDDDASLVLRTPDGVDHIVHTADVGVL
ncbi:biotin-acetyl-CoA-carboxylase ligase [Bifidobacterium saguini DSM 23967]|uniref:Biotin-acetyl-CoA-carboxylase ligase n=2 Tax=Bifidobacterium saguini TaxID=762210 RepID=A0A087D8J3_9BIFI|nr:biotin--[acetyl-CoA-carboxylase] ligase [Bifidobacterium saguini]KFI91843.1 biotin-acetyl-CoA-carboxylase ligase [Bifidobacterium saguini DSM 23967]QTB90146.1 biotin--[acetyl-CoA-carboxylase] ligase [Bifidobacterium saguini]